MVGRSLPTAACTTSGPLVTPPAFVAKAEYIEKEKFSYTDAAKLAGRKSGDAVAHLDLPLQRGKGSLLWKPVIVV